MNNKLNTAQHVVQALLWVRAKHMIYHAWSYGTAIGSLVSETIGNLVMEDVERALATKDIPLHFQKQYVLQLVSGGQG